MKIEYLTSKTKARSLGSQHKKGNSRLPETENTVHERRLPENQQEGGSSRAGVLNLFMVRANMKTGLSDGGHEYTYLGSSVKVAVLLVCTQKICELIQISLTLNLFA